MQGGAGFWLALIKQAWSKDGTTSRCDAKGCKVHTKVFWGFVCVHLSQSDSFSVRLFQPFSSNRFYQLLYSQKFSPLVLLHLIIIIFMTHESLTIGHKIITMIKLFRKKKFIHQYLINALNCKRMIAFVFSSNLIVAKSDVLVLSFKWLTLLDKG